MTATTHNHIRTSSFPTPFDGTPAERRRNNETHNHGGEDMRCYNCDARLFSTSADYPCGAAVPRTTITHS